MNKIYGVQNSERCAHKNNCKEKGNGHHKKYSRMFNTTVQKPLFSLTIWTLDVNRGNLKPPCHLVISHLLKMVKVMLIEYHKNVIDAASKAAATIAFEASLRLMFFPYRNSKEYKTKISSEKHNDIVKYIQRKIKTSI